MKKWSLFLVVLILAFSSAACGSSNSEELKVEESTDPLTWLGDVDDEVKDGEAPELGTIDSGVYTFYSEAAGGYLSFDGNSLTVSNNPVNWYINPYTENGAYVTADKTGLVMDIDNARMEVGTTIKVWDVTGYLVQIWRIQENGNGTYSFLSHVDNSYCLGFIGEDAVLQIFDGINAKQQWEAVEITDETVKGYRTYMSAGGVIELQLPLDIEDTISKDRLQEWADNLEKAYGSYLELTSYKPFEKMIVEAYKPAKHIGYVIYGSNVIRIDSNFLYGDLEKMASREVDWNFCALHEMGHLFDQFRPWQFEAELMTDLKLAYVLEQNNVSAVPSEFDASQNFYGKDIINAYKTLGRDFSQTYDIFGCTARFLEIKEDIGWEPYKQTFYEMQANFEQYDTTSKQEQLENFVSLLSQYSGKDIKGYFSANEWNVLVNKVNANE